MKKIMIIHSSTGYGGASLSLKDTIDMLLPNYQVVLYLSKNSHSLNFDLFSDDNIHVKIYEKHLPIFAHYSGINALIGLGFWKGLLSWKNKRYWYNIIKSEHPDAVLLNSSVLSPMAKIIKKVNSKAICFNRETHNMSYWGFLNRIMQKNLDRMDLVFFLSNSERKHFKFNHALSVTVTDVVNEILFSSPAPRSIVRKNLGYNNQDFIILFLGGISQIKGTMIALKAMQELKTYRNIKLLILGNIENPDIPKNPVKRYIFLLLHRNKMEYVRRCNDLLVSLDNIILNGMQQDVGLYYSAADVLIFPSTKAHQARPVYEAGLYSLPVIISDFPDTKEFAINNINALSFKPNDSNDLMEKIMKLYRNRELANALGEKNKDMTYEIHTFTEQRKIFLSCIDKLMK